MVAMIAINAVLGFVIPGIAWQAPRWPGDRCAAAAIIGYTGHRRDPLRRGRLTRETSTSTGSAWVCSPSRSCSPSIAKYALTNGYG